MSKFMQRVIELAEKARGRTSPNPMVGAVIVKDGKIIGEGFHQRAGEAHAEIIALKNANGNTEKATLYVNLEPCCHFGKTPPCTDAIIKAGISEVHIAMLDPNPIVNGKGKNKLEDAGIQIIVGECKKEAQKLNEVFSHCIQYNTPFAIAKFAMSLDGKIATHTGDSRWITSPESRQLVHKLRNEVDAILVGVNTVIKDNPQLTTRLEQEDIKHPTRIVLDTRGRTPNNAIIMSADLPGKTIIATTQKTSFPSHIGICELPLFEDRVCLKGLMQELYQRNITSILIEGGGTVLDSFFQQNIINKVMAFVAPIIIGGKNAITPVEGKGVYSIKEATTLTNVEITKVASDFLITGIPDYQK